MRNYCYCELCTVVLSRFDSVQIKNKGGSSYRFLGWLSIEIVTERFLCRRAFLFQHSYNCSQFQPIGVLFDRELFANSATSFPSPEMNMALFAKSYPAGNVLARSWKSYKVPSILLRLGNLKPVFIKRLSRCCVFLSGRFSFHIRVVWSGKISQVRERDAV